ncbi:glycosyl hydrolase [Pseudomonas sp. WN033]|nr:glycosyl hydrolase [Pseudomonas sp. WN033]
MKTKKKHTGAALCTVLVLLLSLPVIASDFRDPLVTPASLVGNVHNAHLTSVAAAGERLVAVGARGLIVSSTDDGESWQQIESPVSSDLLDLFFVDDRNGWIVGHDGVVMHSSDGGERWVKQLDGRMTADLLEEHFLNLAKKGEENAEAYLEIVRLNYTDGPEQALMDVWFANENEGFVVGTFGTILATRDGGKTWESWMERVDNPEVLHFMSVSGEGENIFVASERGIVFRLDHEQQRFVAVHTGYTGSFFTVTATQGGAIAAGLRGTLYATRDDGHSWRAVSTGIQAALTDSVVLDGHEVALASIDGRVLVVDLENDTTNVIRPARPGRFSSVVALQDRRAVTVGFSGIRPVSLN